MGGALRKAMEVPVSNEWESLQREAIRIRMMFVGLIQDMEKWSSLDYEDRFYSIRNKWQTVITMILQLLQTGRVKGVQDGIEWSKQMREEMDRLTERYYDLRRILRDDTSEAFIR